MQEKPMNEYNKQCSAQQKQTYKLLQAVQEYFNWCFTTSSNTIFPLETIWMQPSTTITTNSPSEEAVANV